VTSSFPNPLVVMALEFESRGLLEDAGLDVLYTGIGKVNAAITLTRRLADYRCAGVRLPLVINFGTAGSRVFAAHTLVACCEFVQRDMDVSGLGFAMGQTPFEDVPARIEFQPEFPTLPRGVCGTGDSFETGAGRVDCDVVDMEAYALAKVCWRERVRFACAKYVTDGADHAAASDWQSNHAQAALGFIELYRDLAKGSSSAADV
jgi:adenosylhomocysteine nucleosidase